VLGELDLPPKEFALALLQFNIGIEAGQLMVVVGLIGALYLARNRFWYRPVVFRGGSVAALVLGAVWFLERVR
jgi:hypothetical protein